MQLIPVVKEYNITINKPAGEIKIIEDCSCIRYSSWKYNKKKKYKKTFRNA